MVKYLKKALIFLLLTAYCLPIYAGTYYLVRRGVEAIFYDYEIAQSARFNDDDSAHTAWTPAGAGGQDTWTVSTWIKRNNLGIDTGIFGANIVASQNTVAVNFNTSDQIRMVLFTAAGAVHGQLITTQVFRDPTSWYHFVFILDTTNATGGDRMRIFCNGSEITAFATDTNPTQNTQFAWTADEVHVVGAIRSTVHATIWPADMYMAEFHCLDDIAQDTMSNFGETKNNIWIPAEYSGSYGTNGFYLDFSNSGHFGEDQSGNGNDFTDSGLATNDQVLDTPTDNWCTLNVLNKDPDLDLSNGNLECVTGAAGHWFTTLGTMGFRSGKWYAELVVKDLTNTVFGVAADNKIVVGTDAYLGDDTISWGLLTTAADFFKYYDASATNLGGTPAVDDVLQVAVDADSGKIWFGVNNVWLGSGDPAAGTNEAYSGLSGNLVFGASGYSLSAPNQCDFGQLGFTYAPPSGFKALNSSNMDDPTIMDSSDGCVTDSDTGANIPTSLAALRSGWTNYIDIYKNLSNIESWDVIFSDDSSNSLHFDANDAKGAKQSLAVGDAYIGASLRVGATYGIYTASVSHTNGVDTDTAHGLGSATVGIVKITDIAGSWYLVHPDLTAGRNLVIDTNVAEAATVYAAIDNTNVTVASAAPTGTYRVIAIKEVTGYNSVGVYTGNGNADGPYSSSGGRVAVGIYKNRDDADSWLFFSDERLGYNVDNNDLNLDTDAVEGTADLIDIVSQGMKMRSTSAEINTNTEEYIKIEWFAQPGKYSNAR